MRNLRALALAAVAIVALSSVGCGSIGDMFSKEDGQRIYGGIRWDASMIHSPDGVQRFFSFADFPFSLVMDTAFLPITLIIALFR